MSKLLHKGFIDYNEHFKEIESFIVQIIVASWPTCVLMLNAKTKASTDRDTFGYQSSG